MFHLVQVDGKIFADICLPNFIVLVLEQYFDNVLLLNSQSILRGWGSSQKHLPATLD